MEIGSPRGAICSTLTCSPGTQPISINFKKRSLFSNDRIFAVLPAFKSDNLFIQKQVTNVALLLSTSLRFSEMPSTPITKIQFHFLVQATLKERGRLKLFINELLKKKGRRLEQLSFVFCSDEYLLQINQTYLSHNDYTDIITFDLSDKQQSSGEIYISVDRVRENARKFEKTFQEELHRVIFHGVLHLCGYKDKLKQDALAMRRQEARALMGYFTP